MEEEKTKKKENYWSEGVEKGRRSGQKEKDKKNQNKFEIKLFGVGRGRSKYISFQKT